MFIDQMLPLGSLFGNDKVSNVQNTPNIQSNGVAESQEIFIPFKETFESAVQDVIATENQVNISAEMLATGKSDNLHDYSIDIAKAQIAIDLLVELRNKALESYNEVMSMGI